MHLRISLLKPPLIPFYGIRLSLALRLHPVPDGAHYLSRVVSLSNLISRRNLFESGDGYHGFGISLG